MIKFSVIIPMVNSPRGLDESIETVLRQTYAAYEVLLVDSGSSTNGSAAAGKWAEQHPRLIRVLHREGANLAAARNAGLKEARGNYIALLDPGDEWQPDYLAVLKERLKNSCHISLIGVNGKEPAEKKRGAYEQVTLKKMLYRNYFRPSATVFKRELTERVGLFDESTNDREGFEYWLRVVEDFYSISLPNELVTFQKSRSVPEKISNTASLYRQLLKEKKISQLEYLLVINRTRVRSIGRSVNGVTGTFFHF